MQIDIGQKQKEAAAGTPASSKGRVVVSTNPVRQSTFIDVDGNEYDSINPRTRKLIKKADPLNQ